MPVPPQPAVDSRRSRDAGMPTVRRWRGLWMALLALVYLAGVQWLVGWHRLLGDAINTGGMPLVCVAIGVLGSYSLRALRIRAALRPQTSPRLFDVARLFAVHNAANWLLPARTGEISLPLLLRQYFDVPMAHGSGVLLWLRLQDLHVLSAIGGGALIARGTPEWRWAGVLLLAGSITVPLLAYALAPRFAERWPLLRKALAVIPDTASAASADLALAWLAWSVKLTCIGMALSLLLSLPLAAGVLGALGGDVAAVLPLHAPLGAGTYEAGVLAGLSPWRISVATTLAAAVQLHALLLLSALAAGALGLTLRKPIPSTEALN
ncbi:UPF0104 family protein [Sinimarinibacterium sp. CAU 1509]|uniref:lysylphosphatidylglycerol synthase domain-containing protein n=1 Tax=Sinimarinibacterium sp. CAU 1509 TaxID=2562283 RepID=UPI0010AC137C|nr:lysylphosphatidylglycerol synthase domain-containing protein [Sinimarinibacterium sp. CAU 1509]TJY59013.1 UPF0104 family protein [Sinimarinibacterium sp. CAU 1509]